MSLPILMAGASILGGAVNAVQTARANKRNEENWKKQSLMNSASSQSARLRSAGLAPHAAIQQIASNNRVDRAPDVQVSELGRMLSDAGSAYGQGTQVASQALRNTFQNVLDQSNTRLNDYEFRFLTETHDARVLQENENYRRLKYDADNSMEQYFQGRMWNTSRNFQEWKNSVYTNDLLAIQKNLQERFGIQRSLAELAQMYTETEANRANVSYTRSRARNVDLLNDYQKGLNHHMANMWSLSRWNAYADAWVRVNHEIPAIERASMLDSARSLYQTIFWESFDPTSEFYVGFSANDDAYSRSYHMRVDSQYQGERSHMAKWKSFVDSVVPFAQIGASTASTLGFAVDSSPVGYTRQNFDSDGVLNGGFVINYHH